MLSVSKQGSLRALADGLNSRETDCTVSPPIIRRGIAKRASQGEVAALSHLLRPTFACRLKLFTKDAVSCA
jgi:hypothetical protein